MTRYMFQDVGFTRILGVSDDIPLGQVPYKDYKDKQYLIVFETFEEARQHAIERIETSIRWKTDDLKTTKAWTVEESVGPLTEDELVRLRKQCGMK